MVARRWGGAAAFALMVGLAPGGQPAAAAEPAAQAQEERIRELEKRVAELEEMLRKALEAGSLGDSAELRRRIDMLTKELEKARMGEAAAPRELKSVYGLGPAASKVYGVERGVSVGGYGEVLWQDFDATRDDGARTGRDTIADMLRAVLYFGYKFNDTIVFNSEIEFEHGTTGSGDEDLGEVSVEFANIDFLLSKPANVRAGMVLLPIGFVNELHEPPTFLSARRPDVENRIIPSTWREVGVGGFGDVGPFSWRSYVVAGLNAEGFAAGSGVREGRQSGSESLARDVAFTARADYHGLPGLLAGASFYQGESGQGAETAAEEVIGGEVTLYEVHAEYVFRGLQARALWTAAQVDEAEEINLHILGLDPAMDPNDAFAGVGSRLTGWYVEAGYDVLAPLGETTSQSLTPFVRYERYDTQDRTAPGFASNGANDVRLVTCGFSYKPIVNLAIKVDYQDYKRANGTGTDQINAALGWLF
ncbi:MAG TPA: hypothetical protein VJV23_12145 [Candidatus Polarisedimenticolia bacterium]|nr:hypothetical protein [Candidatus Polarisedimenticolia bacterium]